MASIATTAIVTSDLVGSTKLESTVGPEVADTLRREHFELLRQAVAGSRARVGGDCGHPRDRPRGGGGVGTTARAFAVRAAARAPGPTKRERPAPDGLAAAG